MMGYGYGTMMGGGGAAFGLIIWLLVAIDLALVAVWLWQQINKK